MKITSKLLILLIVFPALALLGGFYMQYQVGLQPCPLCIFQRIAYALLLCWSVVVFMLSNALKNTVINKFITRGCAILGILMSIMGMVIAGRQVILQYFPSAVKASCGADLEGLMEMFSWLETLVKVMNGYGDCAEADKFILGLSMAFWSLCLFGIMAIIWLIYFWLKKQEVNLPKFKFS